MRVIPVEDLRPNIELALDILDNQGNILLSKGTILTAIQIQKLRSANIGYAYITDKYSFTNHVSYTAKPENIAAKMGVIRTTIESIANQVNVTANITKGLKLIKELTDELDDQKYSMKLEFEPSRYANDENFETNLYVSMMSTLFALKMGFSKGYATKVCLGSILRDIAIFSPSFEGKYNAKDKTHPKAGYEHMKAQYNFPDEVLDIIVQHHELHDGKGFPRQLEGDEICPGAKIIPIVEAFYALQSLYIKQTSCHSLEKNYRNRLSHFDPNYVNFFLNHVNIFAPDTLVMLNTNDVAIIITPHEDDPLKLIQAKFGKGKNAQIEATVNPFRPTVKILQSFHFEEGTIIDLFATPNMDVSKVLYYADI
ncbi:MAG: hypothetical protein BEN18_08405 [Epulopiscium sp. Nuni2H_MBin001]|nr:MAG: hypothetical protein BEN18_08405 [Epulopiscium sp. Nuni2H_MBin001]